jgi:hypothetical protein
MDQEPARAFPDPWHDPDFSPRQIVEHKPERGSTSGDSWYDQTGGQRSRWLRVRIRVVSLVLLALWLGLLLDPMVGPLILAVRAGFRCQAEWWVKPPRNPVATPGHSP